MIPGAQRRLPPSGDVNTSAASDTRPQTLNALQQGGRPIARRHSLDNGAAALQPLRHQVADLAKQVADAQAKDDLNAVPGAFSRELRVHLAGQHHYEHAATADLFGNQAWLRRRRQQLQSIPGGQRLAEQYGLGFIGDDRSSKPPFGHVDVISDTIPGYQRLSSKEGTTSLCNALYRRRFPAVGEWPRHFVSGPVIAQQMVARFRERQPGAFRLDEVAPGLCAISCRSREDWDKMDTLISEFGARPSLYQLARLLVDERDQLQPVADDPRVDNHVQVDALRRADPQGIVAQLRSVPDSLGTQTLAHSVADMIDDLTAILAMPQMAQRVRHNPVIASGLEGLSLMAQSLPALATDTPRFSNAHRLLMEEMQIVLSELRPYSPVAFKTAASQRLRQLLPAQAAGHIAPVEPMLFSSGMQALMEGVRLAAEQSQGGLATLTAGNRRSPFYFEAKDYVEALDAAQTPGPHTNPAFCTSFSDSVPAHASQPEHRWSVQDMVSGIQAQIRQRNNPQQPLNVVLDSTIERPGDMATLLSALTPALANNQLRLFVCKSQQKFANLGAGKVQGGHLTLLGANTADNARLLTGLKTLEKGIGWFDNDESQLLTHLTRAAVKHELPMLRTAVENGHFLARHCFHGQNGHIRFAGHDPSQPFALLPAFASAEDDSWPSIGLDEEYDPITLEPTQLIDRNTVRWRASFGLAQSTQSHIGQLEGYHDETTRLTFGQESKPELIERFWMASRAMQMDQDVFTPEDAHDLVRQLIGQALTPAQRQTLTRVPLADCLRAVGKNEIALSDEQRSSASVSELRAAAPASGFTLNKVASVIGYLAQALEQNDQMETLADSPERPLIDELLQGLIASGMPGISRSGREQIVRLQCALSHEDMQSDDPQDRRRGAETLLNALGQGNISPAMGISPNAIPDETWRDLPLALQEKLTDVLFSRLDVNSQLEFLGHNLRQQQGQQFLQACAIRLTENLTKASPAMSRQHARAFTLKALTENGISYRPAAG